MDCYFVKTHLCSDIVALEAQICTTGPPDFSLLFTLAHNLCGSTFPRSFKLHKQRAKSANIFHERGPDLIDLQPYHILPDTAPPAMPKRKAGPVHPRPPLLESLFALNGGRASTAAGCTRLRQHQRHRCAC
jgi:hypothetical protein